MLVDTNTGKSIIPMAGTKFAEVGKDEDMILDEDQDELFWYKQGRAIRFGEEYKICPNMIRAISVGSSVVVVLYEDHFYIIAGYDDAIKIMMENSSKIYFVGGFRGAFNGKYFVIGSTLYKLRFGSYVKITKIKKFKSSYTILYCSGKKIMYFKGNTVRDRRINFPYTKTNHDFRVDVLGNYRILADPHNMMCCVVHGNEKIADMCYGSIPMDNVESLSHDDRFLLIVHKDGSKTAYRTRSGVCCQCAKDEGGNIDIV